MEIDVLAESVDRKTLLIGESKWTEKPDLQSVVDNLLIKVKNLPFTKGKKIMPVLFLKYKPEVSPPGILTFGPDDIVGVRK